MLLWAKHSWASPRGIIVGEKSSTAIVSALDNVVRISRTCDSWRPCHAVSLCQQTLSGAYRRVCTSARKKGL